LDEGAAVLYLLGMATLVACLLGLTTTSLGCAAARARGQQCPGCNQANLPDLWTCL